MTTLLQRIIALNIGSTTVFVPHRRRAGIDKGVAFFAGLCMAFVFWACIRYGVR